ncbi:MAG TPA: spermidine/putrescine ABC transporter substrate-binding protein [Pelomicrobium sp.]|nr:spermidine/putrescine ABC transporter substrate-binding protein [Pelomicrobium sp.]
MAVAPGTRRALAQQPQLRLFNWNNYITEESVKRFEQLCGCRLLQDYYADNEEMLAKLAAGATGYDLLVPTGNAVEALIKSNQLRPLDKSKVPNLSNIKPQFLDPWFDPGNRYSVPYMYTLTIIGYNTERVRELELPTDTWALVFEPEHLQKIKGKVTVLDSQRELFAAALIYLGYSVNETDEARLKAARDLILRAKPYWAAFNAGSYFKELAIGNIWVAHGYSNDMFTAQQDARSAGRRFTIGYSTPKEGAVFALDNLVMHKSGQHPDLAHLFMNFWLEGTASAQITNEIGAGNPNAAAIPHIDPELLANRDLFPDAEKFRRLQSLKDYDRATRRLLNRLWVEVKVR